MDANRVSDLRTAYAKISFAVAVFWGGIAVCAAPVPSWRPGLPVAVGLGAFGVTFLLLCLCAAAGRE